MSVKHVLLPCAGAVGLLFASSLAHAQPSRYNDLADLPFQQDYPTDEMTRQLTDELLFQRGVQSYLWALPAVNMWAMKEGSESRFGAWLQRSSGVETALKREDARYHT